MTAAATDTHQRDVTPIVIILRKTQGSVWREAGRTELCPTLDWLRERYGHGEYELQLKLGSRIVCMVNACAQQIAVAAPAARGQEPGDIVRGPLGRGDEPRRRDVALGAERGRFGQRKFA
jgi:hypothetical protein